jgi:hypothetical protein
MVEVRVKCICIPKWMVESGSKMHMHTQMDVPIGTGILSNRHCGPTCRQLTAESSRLSRIPPPPYWRSQLHGELVKTKTVHSCFLSTGTGECVAIDRSHPMHTSLFPYSRVWRTSSSTWSSYGTLRGGSALGARESTAPDGSGGDPAGR